MFYLLWYVNWRELQLLLLYIESKTCWYTLYSLFRCTKTFFTFAYLHWVLTMYLVLTYFTHITWRDQPSGSPDLLAPSFCLNFNRMGYRLCNSWYHPFFLDSIGSRFDEISTIMKSTDKIMEFLASNCFCNWQKNPRQIEGTTVLLS